MKRNENLYPLSWQHHNGLLAVLILRKGVAKNADPALMSQFIQQIWKDELQEHFEAEEVVLKKFIERYPLLEVMFNKMIEDHSQIKQSLDQLKNPNTGLIKTFYQRLENHIRFEEREFFPLIEQTLNVSELEETGTKLTHLHHQTCTDFPVKFWE
ncbi:MAG: hemerythrin domain-containing protein [Sphingobacteriales bacterium]|nr:hemerythrin domain-containing protein [Sphingobacteriales bacterium]